MRLPSALTPNNEDTIHQADDFGDDIEIAIHLMILVIILIIIIKTMRMMLRLQKMDQTQKRTM